MYPGRFFIPNNMGTMMNFGRINPFIRSNMLMPRNINFFNRAINGLRTFNWRGLLNGANKTLNVFNQTIPLIRQAKPMVGNMKSIIQLAKAFGKETNKKQNIHISNNKPNKQSQFTKVEKKQNPIISSNEPTFFI